MYNTARILNLGGTVKDVSYVCTARNRLVLPVVGGTRFCLKKFRTDGIRASWISVQVQLERETLARQQPDRCRGKKTKPLDTFTTGGW